MRFDHPALPDWLSLLRVPGIGPAHGERLLRAFGTPGAALAATAAEWRGAGVSPELHGFDRARRDEAVARDARWLRDGPRELLTRRDPRYPRRLLEIASPPLALFCEGDPALLSRPQVAIVGARFATPQGRECAAGFAAELTRRGLLVTSGLALGIDGAAHQGALAAGGATVAVCGTGLDRVYPARHHDLARRIAGNGVLVSEYPTGTEPTAENFPRRNRIISGLSLGVLVVEASLDSGSLVTARLALEQGREVFAIPGSIHSPQSRGPHALIRQGAKLTESVQDILEEIGGTLDEAEAGVLRAHGDEAAALPELPRRVLAALGTDVTAMDTLVERLSMPVEALSPALLTLELDGRIAAVPGRGYQRVSR